MIRSLVLLQLDKSRLWRIGIEMEQEEIHPAPIANYISSKINTPITYIDDNDNVEIDGCGFGIYLRRNFCSNRFRVIFISIFQMWRFVSAKWFERMVIGIQGTMKNDFLYVICLNDLV